MLWYVIDFYNDWFLGVFCTSGQPFFSIPSRKLPCSVHWKCWDWHTTLWFHHTCWLLMDLRKCGSHSPKSRQQLELLTEAIKNVVVFPWRLDFIRKQPSYLQWKSSSLIDLSSIHNTKTNVLLWDIRVAQTAIENTICSVQLICSILLWLMDHSFFKLFWWMCSF